MRRAVAILVLVCFVAGLPVDALAVFSCGADLNGDGFTDAAGETASCSTATVWEEETSQWFCPVQPADCQKPVSDPLMEKTCPEGFSYVEGRDRCESTPRCAAGAYDPVADQCEGGASHPAEASYPECSAEAQSSLINGSCTSLPEGNCLLGTWRWWWVSIGYHAHFDQACTFTKQELTLNDTHYSWTELNLAPGTSKSFVASDGTTATYTNTSQPVYSCPPGETLSGTNCLAPSTPDCAGGQLDASLDVCYAPSTTTPTCSTGTYDPGTGKCIGETYVCPHGDYACLDTGAAVPQCSPNPCIDVAEPGNDVTLLPAEDPMLQNDGEVDENGNCLGEIYVFSGKATRCRPPGMTVGYANDCCDSSDPVMMDSTTGDKINNTVSAISTAYEMAQVGYYSYQMASGAMAAVEVGGQVVVYNMATGTVAASYASGTATATGVMAAQGTATAGATATGTVSSGLSSYAGALFNPATIAVAIVVMVVMKVMLGNGCDARDIETAMLANSDYCIELGTVCEREWDLIGCVQRAKRFCCFNSKMARIVHEQGRPQLKSFGPGGGWGTAENPNCRGFTPQEFQQLDFARIDLTEYFGDIQKDLTMKVQDAQSAVQQKIEQHYQQTR